MKRLFCLLICAILLLNAVVLTSAAEEVEKTEDKTMQIWVWLNDIPKGTYITEKLIKQVTVPCENAPSNVVVDSSTICGRYANADLFGGEYASIDQTSGIRVNKVNNSVQVNRIDTSKDDYVIVTDYVMPNTGDDLSSFLQEIIDKNPNRTIYFPDGVYEISQPLLTSAAGKNSVSISLSDGAVIKASQNWKNRDGNAMICLGGAESANDIKSIGSYYTLSGGTLDGNNRANCISIDSGRESLVRNMCLRNPKTGIVIEYGVNNRSSDIDLEDITIIGNGMPGTIGIDSEGCDNTYTNIRVYDMEKGLLNAAGEVESIFIINGEKSAQLNTVGITGAWRMSNCVTVNCDTAYEVSGSTIVFDCISVWTSESEKTQTMFNLNGKRPVLSGCRAYFAKGSGVTTNFYINCTAGKEPIIEGSYYE